jgi:diacylglycerol kinase family enzyme
VMPRKSPLYYEGYKRLEVFYHPKSSTSRQLQRKLEKLKQNETEHGLRVTLHETKKDFMENTEHMAGIVGKYPEAIIGAGGGDGSGKHVKQGQMLAGLHNPTMLLGGGSACDLARSLSDRRSLHNLTHLVMNSRLTEVRPMAITLTSEQDVRHDVAFGHFGIGVLALISHYLNNDKVRNNPLQKFHAGHLAMEGLTTAVGIIRSPSFPATNTRTGQPMNAYEILVSGIEREGKIMRPQASVLEGGYSVVRIPNKRPNTVLAYGGRLILGMQEGEPLGEGLHIQIPSTMQKNLYVHSDGEPIQVFPGEIIDIEPYPETVTYTTTHEV